MEKLQAFKFELMPNGSQARNMHRFAGVSRFVYNKALETQQTRRKEGLKHASPFDMNKWLPGWKVDHPWLKTAYAQTLQQALKDLGQAYKNFFEKRAGFPTFKKKGQGASFRFPQGYTLEDKLKFQQKTTKKTNEKRPQGCMLDAKNATILLPKIGVVRYRKSREIEGTIKNVTCSFKAGKWFVSIQTESEVPQPVPTVTSSIGIDLGVANFATLSDGTFVKPLNSFKKHEQRLKKYQRRMSRKVKGSQNYKKARAKVARCHQTITNARQDFLHKLSHQIARDHALVVVEALKVKNMTQSASGTVAKPGKNVGAKRGLNKAILDQGWAEFKRQLEYKLGWNGGLFVEVPAAYTSQTCSNCGHVHKDNRSSQSNFTCVACGHHEHADLNAAKNILAAGHAVFACGGPVSQPMRTASVASPTKQEPNEEINDEFVVDSVGIPTL